MEKDTTEVHRTSGSESPDDHGYQHGSTTNKFDVRALVNAIDIKC